MLKLGLVGQHITKSLTRTFFQELSEIYNIELSYDLFDLFNQNISIEEIKSKITKKTRALICVHFAGFPCNMPEIMKLAKQKNIKVIRIVLRHMALKSIIKA